MACMFVPGMYVTLYCCGLRLWLSAAIAACLFPPMMFVTMLAESKIFRSRFLAAALLRWRRCQGIEDRMRWRGIFCCDDFSPVGSLLFAAFHLPGASVHPARSERHLCGIHHAKRPRINGGNRTFHVQLQHVHPLVVLHSKETLLAVEKTTKALEILLFHPQASLTPAEARRELSAITNKLINPLEYELRIMSQEILGMTVVSIPGMIGALYMLFGTFDNNKMGGVGNGFRITIAALVLIMYLSMPTSSLGNAPKVHRRWRYLSRKLNDAENVSRAAAVFDGDFNAFLEWFRRNEISAKFMGTAIDDELPGKILTLFASIMGAVGLVIARVSGWY